MQVFFFFFCITVLRNEQCIGTFGVFWCLMNLSIVCTYVTGKMRNIGHCRWISRFFHILQFYAAGLLCFYVCLCLYECVYVVWCVCLCVYMHMCVCLCVCVFCLYICMYVCVFVLCVLVWRECECTYAWMGWQIHEGIGLTREINSCCCQ